MTKRKPPAPTASPWQRTLLSGLKALAAQHPEDLRVLAGPPVLSRDLLMVTVSLRTTGIPRAEGGLVLGETEEFVLGLPPVERIPPYVLTAHTRFAGTPHVLEGRRLCIYLDADREWNPEGGIPAVLNRLWQWLTDAAANRFDTTTALYHAVGGVLHRTDDTPTVVAREPAEQRTVHTGWLTPRHDRRLDLTARRAGEHSLRLPVMPIGHHLPYAAGHTLADVLDRIDNHPPGLPRPRRHQHGAAAAAFMTALHHAARRNPPGTCQYFVLAIPHPRPPAEPRFLLAGRLPAPASDALRRTPPRAPDPSVLPDGIRDSAVEWCYLSDERQAVTTRRDTQRPVNAFRDTHVHIWGCGGIGSWAAELIARSGAARITLSDPGTPITGGLLVRQNYTEADIGENKATALARRLRSLRDDLTVDICPPPSPELLDAARQADVIIDATVSITAGRFLDLQARLPGRTAVLAQMTTDTATASHGVLTVSAPGTGHGPSFIDHTAGTHVLAVPILEPYHPLWTEPEPGDEIQPTRGCSVPTFHGSAADLAGTTATLVTLLGMQLHHPVSGTHLCAQPHTGTQPAHHFIPYAPHPDAPSAVVPAPALPTPPTSSVAT